MAKRIIIAFICRQQKLERQDSAGVKFSDLTTYESSCQDVAYIKGQLLELQKLVNVNAVDVFEIISSFWCLLGK